METKFKIAYFLNKKDDASRIWYQMENGFETFEEAETFVKKIIDEFKDMGINKKYTLELTIIEI